MLNDMDDLEVNPLYAALLTTYRREFDLACKKSYLIAIPHSETLELAKIDQYLVFSHILAPSKLLKMHYTQLQANSITSDIELDGKKLVVTTETKRREGGAKSIMIVNILAEELGYNLRNKEYKIILIDKPLVTDINRQSTSRLLGSRRISSSNNSLQSANKRFGPKKPLKDQHDCSRYLESLSQEITVKLEAEVRLMQSNYIMLSKFLDDASDRIMVICENYIVKYEQKLDQLVSSTSDGQNQNQLGYFGMINHRNIRTAVENYVLYLLHGKLFSSIQGHYEKHDIKVMSNFDIIKRGATDVTNLGAQAIFSDFHISDELSSEIRQLQTLQSPLAVITSLTRCIELINDCLNQNVRFKHLIGQNDSGSGGDLVTICSDDLIASLVFCFANVKPNKLYSLSKYLSTFGWNSTSKDQAAYYAATFHLVVQYIYSYSPDDIHKQRMRSSNLNNKLNAKNRPVPTIITAAKPKRVESVKSMDSFRSHRSLPCMSKQYSFLETSYDLPNTTQEDQSVLDCESLGSSSNSSITKSGWTFL